MCHVSQICPYCGGRMTDLGVKQRVYFDNDEDVGEDPIQSNVDSALLAVSLMETAFDDNDDPFVGDDDPSFNPGGGSSGRAGADDSW